MRVDPSGGLRPGVELKLNSYDLSVDIELADIVQRMRFEHPEVRAVVLTGGLEKVFCAGANIQMLAGATHHHKVNFCKFTNETRNAIEDASATSQQIWVCAVNGTAAGGGYELALACDEIVMIDDRSTAVSLPEVPLLAVLPGTGGLTRILDKRHVRRDLADAFCTRAEGARAAQAMEWGLVDSAAPARQFAEHVSERARARAASSDRPGGEGVRLQSLPFEKTDGGWRYRWVEVVLQPPSGTARITVSAPAGGEPQDPEGLRRAGDGSWILGACRELDDAMLRLRFNHPDLGTWTVRTRGSGAEVLSAEALLESHRSHWLVREVEAYWRRTLKRLDLSARSIMALIEPGSCFVGVLAELALAADRTFMLDGPGEDDGEPPVMVLSATNCGPLQMSHGLTRLQNRLWGHPERIDAAHAARGEPLDAARCLQLGLITFAPDYLDWEDEVRLALEERAAFSPDALTGMEANLRFAGPETMESRIFARLTAWQNWIFLRPNASGPEGALRRYGTGSRPAYDRKRV
jgi:benzoyl-CoA-dihydrodiol lyase